jgi:hypothetical protein
MREIPDLQTLCLRSVGSHACSTEKTFAKVDPGGLPSTASRLLRSFLHRNAATSGNPSDSNSADDDNVVDDAAASSIRSIPVPRRPCIGPGSSRRVNANEVDLNHPVVGCRKKPLRKAAEDPLADNTRFRPLVMQYGNPAIDTLQVYIDALVEMGRMDDTRLGLQFFEEWKTLVQDAYPELTAAATAAVASASSPRKGPSRKRRRGSGAATTSPVPIAAPARVQTVAPGSLSLHNSSGADETFAAMVKSGMGPHLRVLDLTGVRGLTDDLANKVLAETPALERLSIKNCRKVTGKTCRLLIEHKLTNLEFLDVGGCFNVTTQDVLDVLPGLPKLKELHASGMQWQDETIRALVELRDSWTALSFGFSPALTQPSLRESLLNLGDSLVSLALPFCDTVVDNALLGALGRNMPMLQYLDLRGNPALNTVTGWYDGRASADLAVAPLTVLARYTGISENSVEETRRTHPVQTADRLLTVVLDGGGMGAGIFRVEE